MAGVLFRRNAWAIVALPLLFFSASAQFHWNLQSGNIIALASTPSGFVAVNRGHSFNATGVIYSPDGITWGISSLASPSWATLAAGNGIYVMAIDQVFFVSKDGRYWTEYRPVESGYHPRQILGFFNGNFLAQRGDYELSISVDGLSWTNLGNSAHSLVSVAFGSGLYVAAGLKTGYSGPPGNQILLSSNLTLWTQGPLLNNMDPGAMRIAFGNGVFVASKSPTGLLVSTNGLNWTEPPTATNSYSDILFANGRFVVCGENGLIARSADGYSWEIETSPVPASWRVIGYSNGNWIIGGSRGEMLHSRGDGEWQLVRTFPTAMIFDTAIINDKAVALSSKELWLSTNLQFWTQVPIPGASSLGKMDFGAGRLVCAGSDGSVFVSTNLQDWAMSQMPGTNTISDICYGNEQFVAVGENSTVLTSKDGMDWRLRTQGSLRLRAVAYGNGMYVAAATGTIVTSPDGINWTVRSRSNIRLRAVAFGRGTFVAAGETSGSILSSSDGINWHAQTRGSIFYTAVFAGNEFFVAGDDGRILMSNDGGAWVFCGPLYVAWTLGYYKGQYFSFRPESSGMEFSIAPLDLRLGMGKRSPEGEWQIPVIGILTNRLAIESSANLQDWSVLKDIQGNGEEEITLSVPASSIDDRQFIRLKYKNDGGTL